MKFGVASKRQKYDPASKYEGLCISLNMSKKIQRYIKNQTSNSSEWIRESGRFFLQLLSKYVTPKLLDGECGKKILTISRPDDDALDGIHKLVNGYEMFFSRSEFYRFSVIFKLLLDCIRDVDLEEIKKLEKLDG